MDPVVIRMQAQAPSSALRCTVRNRRIPPPTSTFTSTPETVTESYEEYVESDGTPHRPVLPATRTPTPVIVEESAITPPDTGSGGLLAGAVTEVVLGLVASR